VSAKPRVFLDTSAVKHSIRSRTVVRSRPHSLKIGGTPHRLVVGEIVEIDPTASVREGRLRTEIDLLSEIARLTKAGAIELLWNIDSEIEFFEIYLVGGGKSDLLDGGVTMVDGPVRYSRILSSPSPLSGEDSRILRRDFLTNVKHPRFLELRRACGALQGPAVRDNQLVDAFHVWCAEHAGASHFLTTDFQTRSHHPLLQR
jgi:hypothetical protein